jgi:thioredoxin-dependent peroxiredoxin
LKNTSPDTAPSSVTLSKHPLGSRTTTFKGTHLTLEGAALTVGDKIAPFELVGKSMETVSSNDYIGKALIVLTVPSLDTPVCSIETKRFDTELRQMGYSGSFLLVSCDLPFAQARWCGAEETSLVTTLSDYKFRSFGTGTGTLIKEWQLLSRAIFIANSDKKLLYIEYVSEVSSEPDYSKALEVVKELR